MSSSRHIAPPLTPSAGLPPTVGAAIAQGAVRLAASGIAESRREARLILGLALSVDPGALFAWPERALDDAARAQFETLIRRRAGREPFSRLKGSREFWSLEFALSPETLDPRPDSETLIEAALEGIADRGAPLHVLDLGTGTGCLLLALLSELPRATGLGIDRLPGAVATARRNAARLGLDGRAQFREGDWGREIPGPVDVILANPPYIESEEVSRLAPEVAFEPRLALDGGADGLDAYRVLAPAIARLLAPGGFACIEVGFGQSAAVVALLSESGLKIWSLRPDLSGNPRCLVAEH
ncbi:MAG: peptide chain release factor N(5)-glutamine methyltransferase [Stellaceae bacterium]